MKNSIDQKENLELIEEGLDHFLPTLDNRPEALTAAMRYAVESGGKRIRPQICLAAAVAAGGTKEAALPAAVAIELLHTYTLIHDDLPAMDNDRERRGRPSVWVKFGEANAILAGDALQALAFSVASKAPHADRVVQTLSDAAYGVVCGQVEDILHTDNVDYIYLHKTSDLFVAAAVMGARVAGASEEICKALYVYGRNLGLAFQFEDDLLDGDSPYSKEETERRILETTEAAVDALVVMPGDATFLRELAWSLVHRSV